MEESCDLATDELKGDVRRPGRSAIRGPARDERS